MKRMNPRKPGLLKILSMLIILVLMTSVCQPQLEPEEIPTPVSMPSPLEIIVQTETDPSLLDETLSDPYGSLLIMAKDSFHPDVRLYSDLYHALRRGVEEFDLSPYDLSLKEKWDVVNAMYSTIGLELFHVYRMNVLEEGESLKISYADTPENFRIMNRQYYARLSHLIYNVPQGESEIQRYFSLYDRICRDSGYTEEIDDEATHTACSILLQGKGICGGYAMLNQHVLTRVGIRAQYLMNEPHAWNLVTLDGKDFITDLTWGAGYSGSPENNLRHILTSTQERNRTLEDSGYSGYPVYSGFYSDEMTPAQEPENDDYAHLYYLYSPYALDMREGMLYTSDRGGIHEMTLQGREKETLTPHRADQLLFFDETLYLISSEDAHIYVLKRGAEPRLLFDGFPVAFMEIRKGILSLTGSSQEELEVLDLNRYMERTEDKTPQVLEEVSLRREDTLSFTVIFSSPMIPDGTFQEAVGLFDDQGELIPLNHVWSSDGKVLTLRSTEPFIDTSSLELRIGSGLKAKDLSELQDTHILKVKILD